MTEYPQRVSDSWNERKRLIRFRRKREKGLHLWQEFKIVPRWLVGTVLVLYLIAVAIAVIVNSNPALHDGEMFPPELRGHPVAQSFGLAGIVTLASLFFAAFIFLVGLSPAYFAIGFIIYFLMRQPLPYNCPQCASTVDARYNFCPNCQCNLHPSCPQCKQEVVESDKYCPYCAQDLRKAPESGVPALGPG